jgi:Sensors of blue-light using FAD
MSLKQLIYVSRPFGFDDATLNSILFSARHLNRQSGLTGALVCRDDIFLQLLEGPDDALTGTYARILRDPRHIDVKLLWSGTVAERLFPRWEMRHDPVQSWLWSRDEIWADAPSKTPEAEIRTIFSRIATEPYDEAAAVV